jgi:FPC/CPF motif-containing protein YcgG
MAKSVFKGSNYKLNTYQDDKEEAMAKLLNDLDQYVSEYDFASNSFYTFIATFPELTYDNEKDFEVFLWKVLQQLHELDTKPWDSNVSSNPEENSFSMSLCGKAFYIVGLHPESSRIARRAPYPTLVFNLHHQFEALREMGVYNNVRDKIRARDEELQGNINPMLRDFGAGREVLQYSGRALKDDWKCPFHHKAS